MASTRQEIFPVVTTQRRTIGDKVMVLNHMMFGYAEVNGVKLQLLKANALYEWQGATANGTIFEQKTPSKLGISEDGSVIGREIYIDDPQPDQWVNWKLFEVIQ